MQIQTPIVTMIAKGTWCINEYGMDAMFLLEGAHKALLIDTGTGTFDVAALVRSITEKPLRVVCTHGHVDHVGGIGFFDEVWLHPDDFEMARTLTREQRQGYVTIMNGMSGGLFSVTEEDVKGFDKLPQLKPLHEGDILDLGGRKVVVYETPGHTPRRALLPRRPGADHLHRRRLQRKYPPLLLRLEKAEVGSGYPAGHREETPCPRTLLRPGLQRAYRLCRKRQLHADAGFHQPGRD